MSVALLVTLLAAPVPANAPQLEVTAPRAELQTDTHPAHLRLWVHANNRLPYPIRRVHLGVLFAADAGVLRGLDPGALYRQGTGLHQNVGVVTQEVDASIPAEGRGEVVLGADLPEGAPAAQAFVTHVLGYSLAEADAPTLLRLLSGSAAADETAACSTLAITDDTAAKQAARQRFGGNTTLVQNLITQVNAAPPAKPTQAEAFRRVYAIRALGVLGGEAATETLRTLLQSPALAAWDEPMQVLRIARLHGSRWETPLAYAVPEDAKRTQDVVSAALEDAVNLPPAPPPRTPTPPVLEPPEPPPAVWPWGIGLATGVLLGAWLWRRRGVR